MFFVIVLIVWTIMHLYVGERTISCLPQGLKKRRFAVLIVFVLMWNGLIISRLVERRANAATAAAVESAAYDWMGVLFLAVVALLAADIATCFGLLFQRRKLAIRRWALLVAIVLSVVAIVQGTRDPVVRDYNVELKRLPPELDGTIVVLASDLHVGSILGKNWLQARADQIMQLNPALVILAGDIVEGHGAASESVGPEFSRISAPLGVWAVNGNHEHHGETGDVLPKVGIHVLRDEWKLVRPGLVIAGIDDRGRGQTVQAKDFAIKTALAGVPSDSAIVFISHAPMQAETAAAMGAGLMVSGHTHNGQIWPFNYIVRIFYSNIHGQYDVNGMPLIVCGGTGTWGPRMRLWGRSEIVRITLRSPVDLLKGTKLSGVSPTSAN